MATILSWHHERGVCASIFNLQVWHRWRDPAKLTKTFVLSLLLHNFFSNFFEMKSAPQKELLSLELDPYLDKVLHQALLFMFFNKGLLWKRRSEKDTKDFLTTQSLALLPILFMWPQFRCQNGKAVAAEEWWDICWDHFLYHILGRSSSSSRILSCFSIFAIRLLVWEIRSCRLCFSFSKTFFNSIAETFQFQKSSKVMPSCDSAKLSHM